MNTEQNKRTKEGKNNMIENEAKKTNLFMLVMVLYIIFASLVYSSIIYLLSKHDIYFPLYILIILSQFLIQLIPFVLYFAYTKKKISDVLSFRNPGAANALFILLMAVLCQPVVMFLSAVGSLFFENRVTELMSSMQTSTFSTIIGILVISITPAIFEEFVYRGIILSGYKKAPVALAAVVSGLFFAVMHMNPQQFLYTFALGCVFALVVHYTKSILSSMLFHFLLNFIQSLLSALLSLIPSNSETAVVEYSFADRVSAVVSFGVIALIFAALFIIVFKAFVKHNKRRSPQTEQEEETEKFNIKSVLDVPFFSIISIYVLFIILQLTS